MGGGQRHLSAPTSIITTIRCRWLQQELFGVARRHASVADDAFVHRRGDHPGELARLAAGDGQSRMSSVAAVSDVEPATGHGELDQRHVEDFDRAGPGAAARLVVDDFNRGLDSVNAGGDQSPIALWKPARRASRATQRFRAEIQGRRRQARRC